MKARWFVSVLLVLAGCQTTPPVTKSGTFDNSTFMSLWGTYRHCESGVDLDMMRLDADHLHLAAQQPPAGMGQDVPLPRMIKRWVAEPANRLAVDPKAMAVACSLRTGQMALFTGKYDLANEMFQVILNYPEASYPYYVSQAREGLAQLSLDARNPEKSTPSSSFTALLVSTLPTAPKR